MDISELSHSWVYFFFLIKLVPLRQEPAPLKFEDDQLSKFSTLPFIFLYISSINWFLTLGAVLRISPLVYYLDRNLVTVRKNWYVA